ncbi:MAG: hypothetical protein QOK39_844 [Acidimicrobiaceae bacterium]|jgi:hypothetical protein|nr:hypothetical protein [Acidimicrobiaceae bacterium]MDX6308670.1 hypothetical protein [Nocardioidaceae bacterium]
MKRKFTAAGAAVALVIGGGAWIGLTSATASTAKPSLHGWPGAQASASKTIASVKAEAANNGSHVLLLRAHQVKQTSIDVGPAGPSVGDYFMFEENLRYQGAAQVVGRDSVRCTFGATSFICDGTLDLFAKGKIVIYGATFRGDANLFPVTGGTDHYQGVGGQLSTANLRHGNELLAFELTR